jgi:GNAT superfamily N-acetyltransferase
MNITTLSDSNLDDMISLYNGLVVNNPYAGILDSEKWTTVMESKSYYNPQDVLIAYDSKSPRGFVHLCQGPNEKRTAPDPNLGSIEAIFFDFNEPDVGAQLVTEAIRHHRSQGAKTILSWSSFSGYPLYRGIFVGLEPMAWKEDQHVLKVFRESGFKQCQHSVLMATSVDGKMGEFTPEAEVMFNKEPWRSEKTWEASTWVGLQPYQNSATVDGQIVATCLYSLMPAISEKYGAPVGCIGGLGTQERWRRKGIASYLVGKAIDHMIELGAQRITVGTQIDNFAAHATYRRFGFDIETETFAFELSLT